MATRLIITHAAGAIACCGIIATLALPSSAQSPPPGRGCTVPASERTGEVGCYLSAIEDLGTLAGGPVYWHIYNYPNRAAAEAVKRPNGTIVEAFGKVWLYVIADRNWRPDRGERVAVVGPLWTAAGETYTARYMEAVFTAGMKAAVHTHSGPEAWYLVSGSQCLETPDGFKVAHAGDSAVVPEGPPMALSSVGGETRRSVLVVLHDASKPWVTLGSHWQPKGLCPK